MSKMNLTIAHYAYIHDLLPYSLGVIGRTTASIYSRLRHDGLDVSRKQVDQALQRMKDDYGLIRTSEPCGTYRWKRRTSLMIGHCFCLDHLRGDPLDPGNGYDAINDPDLDWGDDNGTGHKVHR